MMFRLSRTGLRIEKRTGFGTKRYMLVGRKPGEPENSALAGRCRRIAVIGAGVAGSAAAHALAARGHEVVVVEAAAAPAQGASGNHAGVFRPLPSLDDSRLARILRAGFLLGRRRFGALPGARLGWTGALHIARDARHEETQRRIVAAHALPADFCRFVARDEASTIAGWPVELGGWWFPQAGWINPPSLCRALLAGIDCRFGQRVARLERGGEVWCLLDAAGGTIATADEVVLANGIDAPALAPEFKLPIRAGRGLVSHIPEDATPPFRIVATRLGYVTPAVDGMRCAGATSFVTGVADDLDATPRLADHVENLQRLDMVLPGFGQHLDPAGLAGRVSFRPMSPDRLPIVGPLSASEGLWIIDGFGARGLVFASICAELLASRIGGEPLPLEADLVEALASARFAARPRAVR
jgi:tRNA 5-methylaminomethyl-2-thiouridine biosynthesis bifunctional protein